jgi:hypothetical protein
MDPGRPGVWVCMSVKEESKGFEALREVKRGN